LKTARIFTPENRLARHLRQGGPTPAELIAEADSRVTALAGSIRVFVTGKLQEIVALCDQSDDVLFAKSDSISGLAMNVAEVAGAARLDALGDVARGVITMIEGLKTLGVWHTDALRVHIRSLSLLNPGAAPMSPQDQAQIVENLRDMRQSIGLTA
tara:strand:+ start:4413 stop:4880 length:468 start_codon:yes stop_codon:yes gene_type:complete